jgi:hypothetical protein
MTSRHEARYTTNQDSRTFALIVRIDRDGEEQVIRGFEGRHFASRKNAERAVAKHFAKFLGDNQPVDAEGRTAR